MELEREKSSDSKELLRETQYPHYQPATGVGAKVERGPEGAAASSQSQSNDGAASKPGYFESKPASSNGIAAGPPSLVRNETAASSLIPPSSAGLTTPSTTFGYSPAVLDNGHAIHDSPIDTQHRDGLPSPVVEEDEDGLSIAAASTMLSTTSSSALPTPDRELAQGIDALELEGIQVVPSTKAQPMAKAPEGGSAPQTSLTPKASALPTLPAEFTKPDAAPQSKPPVLSHPVPHRPAPPEKKKSMFGKLFHHDKASDSADSSARSSPALGMSGNRARSDSASRTTRERGNSSATSALSSANVSDNEGGQPIVRGLSTASHKEDGHSAFGKLLGRRSSNKKLDKPDPTLVAMAQTNVNKSTTSAASSALDFSPSASNTTLPASSHLGTHGISSTAVSRGSTPDHAALATRQASPARPEAHAHPSAKSMVRRPSGSESGKAPNGDHHSGAPIKEKTLKEHLAALGSSAGIGKLNRKTSQTSRRSDDGRSEKSHGVDDHHAESGYATAPAPKRTPSVGGASNASTSLLKKYGVCEKVAIGKGATAVVRLAHKWDRSTEKLYAVKEFRKRRKNETEKEYVKKLTSEFCISSTLHHINVVETVDLVQNEEKHWCEVMEYCPGGDLYAAIKKGDMAPELANNFFKQIVTGVAYLHSMGVAHRDIKPENLLLDGRGHVKITDFGVSDVFRMCWEKQTHMSKGLCGSEPYIAPEQFEAKEYDARLVDVWACAVVYYCMHAQELPWRVAKPSDPSFQEYIQAYPSTSSPPPLGNLHPREARALLKKMLDPNPKHRIGMDAVLADPWMKSIDYTVDPIPAATLPIR